MTTPADVPPPDTLPDAGPLPADKTVPDDQQNDQAASPDLDEGLLDADAEPVA